MFITLKRKSVPISIHASLSPFPQVLAVTTLLPTAVDWAVLDISL